MLTLLALSLPVSAQELVAGDPDGCRIILDGTNVFFEGCNVHIRNDLGATNTKNGLGNLIVGYNETGSNDATRSGSHNVVVGEAHGYEGFASLVTGRGNVVRDRAAVIAAETSTASAHGAVLGGRDNLATFGAVVGGLENVSLQEESVVVGGFQNLAYGTQSTVCGGAGGKANGAYALAAGGSLNRAHGDFSVVTGGAFNWGNAVSSTIFGGVSNWVGGDGTVLAGDSCSTVTDVLVGATCTPAP